jgi:uncharacterized protein HemX
MQMEMSIMDNINLAKKTEKEFINFNQALYMRENLKMKNFMDKDL